MVGPARKKRRLGNTENGTQRLRAERINHVWSYDFGLDPTESGGRLKWLPVLDEFTRECLSLEVGRSMASGDVLETLFIEPGSPWQNCYTESFNASFRDEFLNVESFSSLLEAKVLGSEHRDKYKHRRPHSSLGDLTSVKFAATCLNNPRNPRLEPRVAIDLSFCGNKTPNKPSIAKTNKKLS